MPKVSVLMPVYNTDEVFLKDAVSSILLQTFTDFEFIIINDGSTNNAKAVIESFSDSRIKLIDNEQNLGIIKTLNKGLDAAHGEYIVRMDSDDIAHKERLRVSVEFMDNNPNLSAAGSYANGFPVPLKYRPPVNNMEITNFLRYVANCMIHPSMIIRASVLKAANLRYDESYPHCEDYKLWIELNRQAPMANIPQPLLNYRIHKKSVSVEHNLEQQNVSRQIIWECLAEDFAPKKIDKVRAIAKKISSDVPLTFFEAALIVGLMADAVKIMEHSLSSAVKKEAYSLYQANFIMILSVLQSRVGMFLLLFGARIGKYLNFDFKLRLQIMLNLLNKLNNPENINA